MSDFRRRELNRIGNEFDSRTRLDRDDPFDIIERRLENAVKHPVRTALKVVAIYLVFWIAIIASIVIGIKIIF